MSAAQIPEARTVRARLGRALAVAAAALASILVAAAAPGTSSEPQAKAPFPHRSHVPAVWYGRGSLFEGGSTASAHEFDKLEVARDCRGCHDFGAQDAKGERTRPARSPMDVCADCHYDDVIALEIQPGFEKGLREGRGSLSAFEHLDHGNMACRECHAPPADGESQDFSALTGVPACVTCHTKGGEEREYEALAGRTIDRSKLRTGFLDWLNSDPSMTREGRGPYPHDAHMTPAKLADQGACLDCHADVEDANAIDLHEHEFTAEECATCHVQRDGSAVRVEEVIEKRPSISALTFAHEDHLGSRGEDGDVVSAGSRAKIDTEGCLACHAHSAGPVRAPDGSALPATFVLREDRDDYQGCLSCHDVPRFRAPNHGEWEKCNGCHTFGDGDPKTARTLAAVDRITAGDIAFLMDAQAHPGLAGKPQENCAACHRAALPELPSRIAGQRFEHASHLGREPTTEDCQVCHPAVAGSTASAAIGLPWDDARAEPAPAEQRLTFDASACNTCHPGIRVDPTSISQPARRDVVAFAHADHMGRARDPRTGDLVSCTSCHDFTPGERARDIGVRAEALTCVQCHQHDDANAEWTGGISAAGVASCEQCHASGLPRVGVPPEVDRVRVALMGAQHHPEDRGCWECHIQEPPGNLAPVTAVLSSFPKAGAAQDSQRARSPHRRTSTDPNDRAFYGPQETCQSCHWSIQKNQLRGDERVTGRTRELNGSRMLSFPGGVERPR